MSSRDAVLNRIRAALAADDPRHRRSRATTSGVGDNPPGSGPVIELMVDRLVDYKAEVREVTPAERRRRHRHRPGRHARVGVSSLGTWTPTIARACAGGGRTVTADGDPPS